MAKKIFPAAALLFAAALVVGVSVPANAFYDVEGSGNSLFSSRIDGQSLQVDSDVASDEAARAKYSVSSPVEVIASARGGSYTPTTGAIRWPFPYATPITDGFGMRRSPCGGCSTFHKGTDFTPGAGVPVYAIASGVVEASIVSGAGLGNEVIINHTIKGQPVQSLYGHLQMSSSPLRAGDTVKVGDLVGKVGTTGTTTGANMHLEVHLGGSAVNPYSWLAANTTNKD